MFNILLQVMDNASLTDNTGRTTDFRNAIVILTTNAGAREATKALGFAAPKGGRADLVLKDIFPPEFRNRLDAVVQFNPLPEPVILQIVDKNLLELENQLFERNVTISATDAAREHFAKQGYNPEFGAREMGRVIQEQVKRRLAEMILFGDLRDGGHAEVDYVDGEVLIRARPLEVEDMGDAEGEDDAPEPIDA